MFDDYSSFEGREIPRNEEFSDMTKAETAHYIQLMEQATKIKLTTEQRMRMMKKNRNSIDTFFSDKFLSKYKK